MPMQKESARVVLLGNLRFYRRMSNTAHPEHVRTVCLVVIAGILSAAALHWLEKVMAGRRRRGVFVLLLCSVLPSLLTALALDWE